MIFSSQLGYKNPIKPKKYGAETIIRNTKENWESLKKFISTFQESYWKSSEKFQSRSDRPFSGGKNRELSARKMKLKDIKQSIYLSVLYLPSVLEIQNLANTLTYSPSC